MSKLSLLVGQSQCEMQRACHVSLLLFPFYLVPHFMRGTASNCPVDAFSGRCLSITLSGCSSQAFCASPTLAWKLCKRRHQISLAFRAVLHLKKDVTFARLLGWDKGTTVNIHSSEVAIFKVLLILYRTISPVKSAMTEIKTHYCLHIPVLLACQSQITIPSGSTGAFRAFRIRI